MQTRLRDAIAMAAARTITYIGALLLVLGLTVPAWAQDPSPATDVRVHVTRPVLERKKIRAASLPPE